MSTAPSSMLILPISLYLSPLKEMFFLASFLFHSFPATISLPPLSDVFLSQPSISLFTTDNVFTPSPPFLFLPVAFLWLPWAMFFIAGFLFLSLTAPFLCIPWTILPALYFFTYHRRCFSLLALYFFALLGQCFSFAAFYFFPL